MANNVFVGTDSTWTTTSNWSLGTPTGGQTVFLTNSNTVVTAGLDNHTTSLASLSVAMDFTGRVGVNAVAGTSANTYLQIASPLAVIGQPASGGYTASGSNVFNWNAGTTGTNITVLNTANSGSGSGQSPVKLLGSAMTITLTGGIISVASLPSETATINSMSVTSSGQAIPPQAYLGPGCNITALTVSSGYVCSYSQQAIPTALLVGNGASLAHMGSGGFSTLTIGAGATATYIGTGTITTLTLTGVIDLSGGGGPVTLTNTSFYKGAVFKDPLGRSVFTNPPTLVNCSRSDISINLGNGRYT